MISKIIFSGLEMFAMKRFTQKYAVCLCVFLLFGAGFAQPKKPVTKTTSKKVTKVQKADRLAFEKIKSVEDLPERSTELRKFMNDFPNSDILKLASEALVLTLKQIADVNFEKGEIEDGREMYMKALKEASSPISDELFLNAILPIPKRLLELGQIQAFEDCEKLIEEKIGNNSKQSMLLAVFHVGREDGETARRIVERVVFAEPDNATAHNLLGTAYRMNFQIADSEREYTASFKLDPTSINTQLHLADMRRAVGNSSDALALYRQILETLMPQEVEKNPRNKYVQTAAQNGVVLSLFDLRRETEAEQELKAAIEANPKNVVLLASAAYWYAANRNSDRAIELANQAIAIEPRYVWTHVALARAFEANRKPLDAEKALVYAKQFAAFPTLDYELASARAAAGFFEEAADDLSKAFVLKDGNIETKLGGKITKNDDNFVTLLDGERLASIFQPLSADSPENSKLLKSLLNFTAKLAADDAKNPEKEAEIIQAADAFVGGNDLMKAHRQIFAASRLLQKQIALPKVLELVKDATYGIDSALNVAAPNAATLADELFEPRRYAFNRGTAIIVPDIPRQTLLAILRNRIEEISGWALFNQGKYDEAVVRLKRAVSVAPDRSAWWRSSLWKLAASMDASGKSREALDIYGNVYRNSSPDDSKRKTIEMLYVRVRGNSLGLEKFLGEPEKPAEVAENKLAEPNPLLTRKFAITRAIKVEPTPEPTPEVTPETTPKIEPLPVQTPEVKIEPTPEAKVLPTPETKPIPTPEVKIEPTPNATPEPEALPTPTPELKIEPTPEVTPKAEPLPTPTPEAKVEPMPNATPEPEALPTPTPELKIEPTPEVTPKPEPLPTPTPEAKVEPTPEVTPKPEPTPVPETNNLTPTLVINSPPKADVPVVVQSAAPPLCQLLLAHPAVWVKADGGTLGITLVIEGRGNIADIKAISSSANDVDVVLQSEIGKTSNRASFLIRSVSPNKGEFSVNFDSPCGQQVLKVTVR